ncbi:gluconate 2-dehydrogenase subunit 3 family protein [Pseudoduganella sp. LjRoot289]|uniref:gluconate 2-dehydrogenase subunit 3 family protein n=1 Tax=Pseudoduganella sp. LjRoot289 TaxID=3342314 RepID=UPI003ECDD171
MIFSQVQFKKKAALAAADGEGAQHGVSRREVITALLAGTALAVAWTSSAAAAALQAAGAPAVAARAGLSAGELAVLSAASQVIVPATDTPGAKEAGVPQFIGALYANWMNDGEASVFRTGLAGLDASAQQRYQCGYADCTPEQGAEILQALRAGSPYAGRSFSLNDRILDPKATFYLRLRDLVVLGYFTSEAGSNQELRYMPVPGKFESNVDIKAWPYQVVI